MRILKPDVTDSRLHAQSDPTTWLTGSKILKYEVYISGRGPSVL